MKTIMKIDLEEIYGGSDIDDSTIDALINRSLNPRPSTMLYDKMGTLGLGSGHLLLDVGCRDTKHTCELVKRYDCRAIGIDPVADHIKRSAQIIGEAGLQEKVSVQQGVVESLPLDDDMVDFIWCRDVLTHIEDLKRAFAECARVLKPNGKMLIYQTLATDALQPAEADWLYPRLLAKANSMSFASLERAFTTNGLTLLEKDVIGSEWREWWEENGVNTTSKQLLQIARMRRNREELICALGEAHYEIELANCVWGVYQMLGKLEPICYTLSKLSA